MRPRPALAAVAAVVLAAGTVTVIIDGITGVIIGVGLVLVATNIAAVDWMWHLFSDRLRPLEEVFLHGLEMGRGEGYRAGHRDARPVVVPARCPSCGEPLYRRSTG